MRALVAFGDADHATLSILLEVLFGAMRAGCVPVMLNVKLPADTIHYIVRDAAGSVFHAYSRYGRGVEVMMGTYPLLDLLPKGRDEDALPYPMAWVRHHDRYEPQPVAKAAGGSCCA